MTPDVVKLTININCHTQSAERPQGPTDPPYSRALCIFCLDYGKGSEAAPRQEAACTGALQAALLPPSLPRSRQLPSLTSEKITRRNFCQKSTIFPHEELVGKFCRCGWLGGLVARAVSPALRRLRWEGREVEGSLASTVRLCP